MIASLIAPLDRRGEFEVGLKVSAAQNKTKAERRVKPIRIGPATPRTQAAPVVGRGRLLVLGAGTRTRRYPAPTHLVFAA